MRAIWRGAVSFGLVSVPVRVYTATAAHEVRFNQVHAEDGGRIHYRKVCSVDGEEVASGEISKAFDTGNGLVILTDDDLAALPLASGRQIEVVEFVPAEQIDPVLFDKTYYLEPDSTAAKPYALLREALTRTERVAVVTVALRQRESLALLRVRGDVICLQTLLWPAEVREPDIEVPASSDSGATALKPREVAMAQQLVESLAADFDPSAYRDRYTEAVRELVTAKIERGEVARPAEPDAPQGAQVVDLLAALQRSVERARGAKADGGSGGTAAGGEAGDPRPGGAVEAGGGGAAAETEPAPKRRAKAKAKTPASKGA